MRHLERESRDPSIDYMWIHLMDNIERYEGMEMIHRPTLWNHVHLVKSLAGGIGTRLQNHPFHDFGVDIPKVARMAMRHDDPEMIVGDIPWPIKKNLTPAQTAELKANEKSAAPALARYLYNYQPGSEAYETYVQTLEEYEQGESLEARIVRYADVLEALGEMFHEIRCGNDDFLPRLELSRQKLEKIPVDDFFIELRGLGVDRYFPSADEVETLPRLDKNTLTSRQEVFSSMSREGTEGWPEIYRSWALANVATFMLPVGYPDSGFPAEKYVFPGWYLELWNEWNDTPRGKTTLGGIYLP